MIFHETRESIHGAIDVRNNYNGSSDTLRALIIVALNSAVTNQWIRDKEIIADLQELEKQESINMFNIIVKRAMLKKREFFSSSGMMTRF